MVQESHRLTACGVLVAQRFQLKKTYPFYMQITIKKYRVIAKVGNEKFVIYRVNNLILFAKFLDKDFPEWRFFNVYEYIKGQKGQQLGNFTKNNRPTSRYIN